MANFSKSVTSNEQFWENILSEDAKAVKAIIEKLNDEEKNAVSKHLTRMITEDGWHPSQVKSAQFALSIIKRKKLIEKNLDE